MRAAIWTTLTALALACCLAWGQQVAAAEPHRAALRLPWREAGLTERQAAAHLLNRFAFGPRPGEVDQVIATGLERWFERQLAANLPDPNLEARLRDMPALALSEAEIVRVYKNPGQVLAEAQKEGVISKEELAAAKADNGLKDLYRKDAGVGGGGGNGNGKGNGRPGSTGGSVAGAAGGAGAARGVGTGGGAGAAGPAGGAGGAGAAGPAGGAGAAGGGGGTGAAGGPATAAGFGQDIAREIANPELRGRLLEFARRRGYHPERELQEQLVAQKLYRAAESQNQLQEVMTDFWFNHFNISQTNGRARPYILAYERDAIRPHALGTVRSLLEGTARHPAMLYYLDNAESTAAPNAPTLLGDEMQGMRAPALRPGFRRPFGYGPPPPARPPNVPKPHGLNENYARELMELHTLGVDGGYTQQDVIEVARAFTGWTVLPAGPGREAAEKRLEQVRRFGGLGFRLDGDFLFRADMHDSGPKVILGQRLPAGRGIEDGEEVLDLLALHAATARHLSAQLAARFVSDNPPPALVARLAATYESSGGNVRALLRTLVQSREFWSREAVGAKVKSPFELAVSAVRVSGAHIENPRPLLGWIARMGQPLYAYQAPTGYPDRADAWVNTGSLLNRMNFGLQFASQRIAGIDMDLPSLHDGPEPESREAALRTFASLLLPGRELGSTIKLLTPMVSDPAVPHRVDEAAPKEVAQSVQAHGGGDDMMAGGGGGPSAGGAGGVGDAGSAGAGAGVAGGGGGGGGVARAVGGGGGAAAASFPGPGGRGPRSDPRRLGPQQHAPTAIEQVVGVVLGSPEFQRR
jgi:uncharacterized protein (DUF1800 family)